ncbi:MAG: thioredoxin domain-containing protein [Patescibacteria group bacterium]
MRLIIIVCVVIRMETVQKLAVPIAIVLAGALIAGALYFVNQGKPAPTPAGGEQPPAGVVLEKVRGPQADDHIRGNPNAEVVIVEYSDTECPFCKNFHNTMKQIASEYGADGKVAWVYRHFPLTQLHPKAENEAQALECAAELGGNDGFWKYTDALYEATPSNNGFDAAQLPVLAEKNGLNKVAFEKCLASGKHADRVSTDMDEVIAAGGRGTPHSIVIFAGEQFPIEGGQPYEVVKGMIDALLAKSE